MTVPPSCVGEKKQTKISEKSNEKNVLLDDNDTKKSGNGEEELLKSMSTKYRHSDNWIHHSKLSLCHI